MSIVHPSDNLWTVMTSTKMKWFRNYYFKELRGFYFLKEVFIHR